MSEERLLAAQGTKLDIPHDSYDRASWIPEGNLLTKSITVG